MTANWQMSDIHIKVSGSRQYSFGNSIPQLPNLKDVIIEEVNNQLEDDTIFDGLVEGFKALSNRYGLAIQNKDFEAIYESDERDSNGVWNSIWESLSDYINKGLEDESIPIETEINTEDGITTFDFQFDLELPVKEFNDWLKVNNDKGRYDNIIKAIDEYSKNKDKGDIER